MADTYLNLFLDAGISNGSDQAKYARCLDVVISNEGIGVADIVGLGERGTGSNLDLYVVHRQGVTMACERGIFNKRIETQQVGSIASIARLVATQEGFKGTDLTITAHDGSGAVLFKIVWGLGGPDWVEPLVQRQRQHLFEVISTAMDTVGETPARPSVSSWESKADALMDWATDVVKASGATVTHDLVEEHANMAAGGIRMFDFLRLGAPFGIDDLNKFFPGGQMPAGTPLETFDDLYAHVVAKVGSARLVDQAIDEQLDASWSEFVNGCRQTYA